MELVWQELTLGLDSTRHAAQIVFRMIAAVLFGFLVGMQREKAGKPAGVRCIQLGDDARCLIFGHPARPAVCSGLQPSA